jgi:hypothetical protein
MSHAVNETRARRLAAETRPAILFAYQPAHTLQYPPADFAQHIRSFAHRAPFVVVYGPENIEVPDVWLARLFFADPKIEATCVTVSAPSLDQLRWLVPRGLHRTDRRNGDDPPVVELYL